MTVLPQPALYWNYENHHACLWGLGLCLLLLSSTQVQELIINKDPTLLDNFLDVSDQPGDKVKGRWYSPVCPDPSSSDITGDHRFPSRQIH